MGCFENPIVVSGSILCNILYCIVELFSLVRGRKHGWLNHVKTSCTVCVIVLSLCSWTNIFGIKAFAGTTRRPSSDHKTCFVWLLQPESNWRCLLRNHKYFILDILGSLKEVERNYDRFACMIPICMATFS